MPKMSNPPHPTSWPPPPTRYEPDANPLSHLVRDVKSDVAGLVHFTEAAADRIATVLKQVRMLEPTSANEGNSHESDLSLTIRDHPFASFGFLESTHFDAAFRSETRTRTDVDPTPVSKPTLSPETAAAKSLTPTSTNVRHRLTYDQARSFLAVNELLNGIDAEAQQFKIVKVNLLI